MEITNITNNFFGKIFSPSDIKDVLISVKKTLNFMICQIERNIDKEKPPIEKQKVPRGAN